MATFESTQAFTLRTSGGAEYKLCPDTTLEEGVLYTVEEVLPPTGETRVVFEAVLLWSEAWTRADAESDEAYPFETSLELVEDWLLEQEYWQD